MRVRVDPLRRARDQSTARQGEERPEVGVTGYDDSLLLGSNGEKLVILGLLQTQFGGVDGVVTGIAQQLRQAW
jgi:hypothetical protein